MSKKENFNQAVFDMFGVGRGREEEGYTEQEAITPEEEAITPEKEAPAAEPVSEMVPQVQTATEVAVPAVQTAAPAVGPTVAPFSVVAATYIAPGTVVEGVIRCKGDIEIAGEQHGDVESEGDVTVRTSITGNITAGNLRVVDCRLKGDSKVAGRMHVDAASVIEGNVEAAELICSGIIRGDSRVSTNITLDASAKVFGNIVTDTMSMERGASISGGLVMGKRWDDDDDEMPKKKEE